MQWWCQMTNGITNNESKTVNYCALCTKRQKWNEMRRNTQSLLYFPHIFRFYSFNGSPSSTGHWKDSFNRKRVSTKRMAKKRHIFATCHIFFLFFFAVPAFAFVLNSYFLQFPEFSSRLNLNMNKTWMPNIMSVHYSCTYIVFIPNCFWSWKWYANCEYKTCTKEIRWINEIWKEVSANNVQCSMFNHP